MEKKITKKEVIVKWSSYELEGNLPDIISKLQNLIKDNPNCFDFEIELENESGYYGESSTNVNIDAKRWETDEELIERITAKKIASERARLKAIEDAKANEKKERTLYESLKRKFEKEINEGNEELQAMRKGV